MTESVCAEFIEQFPVSDVSITHADRIKFMLTHPTIRSKLNEWTVIGKPDVPSEAERRQLEAAVKNGDVDGEAPPTYQEAANAHASPAYTFEKNTNYSVQKREEGNAHFQKKKLYDSLECYNEAIRFANFALRNSDSGGNDDLSLPIAFANRSAVFYDMGKDFLQRSLSDADHSLDFGYPENMKIKILVRKAMIYIRTKRFSSAEECLSQAKILYCKHRKSIKAPADILKKISKAEQEIVRELQPSTSDTCKRSLSSLSLKNEMEESDKNSSQFKQNPQFDGAAESVKLSFSKDCGRYVTCTSELNAGDIVFQERPFASILIPEFYESYCYHCHVQLKDGYFFPCIHCTQVKFCGQYCSENAWNQYHQYECLNLELLQSVGIAHLALRVVLVAGVDQVLNAINKSTELNDPSNISVFAQGESNYQRIYALLDHSRLMHPEDLFQYTLTAGLLTNFLSTKTRFFDLYTNEDRMKVGGVILRHISQLISNAYAITTIISDFNSKKISLSTVEECQMKIASAIYPSASMMNHSCEPNIGFEFSEGNQIIVKVSSKLKRREQIFNCYGPHFRRSTVKERQEVLNDQYFFRCNCKSCQKEEEEGFSFADQFRSLKCYKCDGSIIPDEKNETFMRECMNCNEFQNIREQLQLSMQTDRLFTLGHTLLEEGKVEEAIQTFKTVYEGRQGFLYKFNSELGEVCDTLGRCYSILGNFSEAIPYVKKSVDYTAARFGNPSVEYTREFRKYTELVELEKKKSEKVFLASLKGVYNKSDNSSTSKPPLYNCS